jgi:CheY-like chemotaxis protein
MTISLDEHEAPQVHEEAPLDITLPDTEESGKKKILVAKKFLLERRVLTKVLENLGYDYDIVEEMDDLTAKLASGEYDILFTDANLVTDTLKAQADNIAIITDTKVKDDIENVIKAHRG